MARSLRYSLNARLPWPNGSEFGAVSCARRHPSRQSVGTNKRTGRELDQRLTNHSEEVNEDAMKWNGNQKEQREAMILTLICEKLKEMQLSSSREKPAKV